MSLSRRAAFAAPLAVVALAAPAEAQSPILAMLRECGQRMAAMDRLAEEEDRAREAELGRRITEYQGAVASMVDVPAANPRDILAKLSVALAAGVEECGQISLSRSEERLFFSAFDDLRRLCPEVGDALFGAA
jgi:hypothetical protein